LASLLPLCLHEENLLGSYPGSVFQRIGQNSIEEYEFIYSIMMRSINKLQSIIDPIVMQAGVKKYDFYDNSILNKLKKRIKFNYK